MSKIFIVDDDSSIRRLAYELFTSQGHQVVTIPRGEEMIMLLAPENPDLILLDLQMPGENGLSLLKRMPLVKGRRIPVVIFSAYVTAEVEKEAYEAGAVEVILKGLDISELRQKITKILAVKHEIFKDYKPPSLKLLAVDDEENIRKLLTQFFTRKGFQVITAADGESALEMLTKEKPSVILLDVMMKGMDGILTLKKIREMDAGVGVVMATSVQDEHIAREALGMGAYAYVLKPFDLQYLELVVQSRLRMAV